MAASGAACLPVRAIGTQTLVSRTVAPREAEDCGPATDMLFSEATLNVIERQFSVFIVVEKRCPEIAVFLYSQHTKITNRGKKPR